MVHDKRSERGRVESGGLSNGRQLREEARVVGVDRTLSPDSCSACGDKMRYMGHCKYWCMSCGFQLTCNDTI